MAPPGMKKKPGLMVDAAVGKSKPSGMNPPGMEEEPDDMPDKPEGDGKKHTEAEAHPVRADQHCSDCTNYQAESGECSKVEGYWDPDDACVRFFEASGESEPDSDDIGGPSDSDADNMPEDMDVSR